jgi:hypothetical protein
MKFSDLRSFVFEKWESSRRINRRRQAASAKRVYVYVYWPLCTEPIIEVINNKTGSVPIT